MANTLNPEFLTPDQRLACMLLLDTSGSMAGERIALLNSGLHTLLQGIREDDLAPKRVDLAIMTFDSSVTLIHDFVNVERWEEIPQLEAHGETCMGAALVEGLRRIQDRKQEYVAHGIPYLRPWMFLLTDGESTDSTDEATEMLRQAQMKKRVTVWPIGVGPDVDLGKLKRITHAPAVGLQEARWKEMFVWMSKSVASVSHSSPGEQIALPTPEQWMKLEV